MTFEDFKLDERLLKAVKAIGYERPTPIQEQAIPLVMSGRDILGSAQTGTGKTAAFGLPLLHHLLKGKRIKNPRVLILSPTRELAAQIDEALRGLAQFTKLRVAPVFGGVSYKPQIQHLKDGLDVLVATPGRLLDHVGQGRVDFSRVEIFILDEADRMMDMGFMPDVKRIVRLLPAERQTMLFSATIPPEIARLAERITRNPEQVQVGQQSSTAVGITHAIYPVSAHLKPDLMLAIIREIGSKSVLVFTRTRKRADRLMRVLTKAGMKIATLHGERTQRQRMAALDGFKKGKYEVLVATDIAARGLDVAGITHVINFDVPATPEDYVHRTGRTARAEALGDAFTLVSPEEEIAMHEIETHLGKSLPRVALGNFDYDVPQPERQTALQRPSVSTTVTKRSFHSSHRRKIPRKR